MNLKQSVMIIIIIFLIGILPVSEVSGLSYVEQQNVRIGIRFGSTATPLTRVYSKNGLEIGFYKGNEFKTIESYLSDEELLVRKDSYYLNLNGSFIEFEFDEQKDNRNVDGPIHIEIGDSFETYEDAKAFLQNIPSMEYEPFIVSENGWRGLVGAFYKCK